MARWGIVERGFWRNSYVRALSDDAKLLLLYLFTGPHGNAAGCFVLASAYVAADLKWSVEKVEERFAELLLKPFLERDADTDLVLLLGWWGHNPISNPNTAKNIVETIGALPDCEVKRHCINNLKSFGNGYKGVRQTVAELLAQPFANTYPTLPYQDQDQTKTLARARANGVDGSLDGELEQDFKKLFWPVCKNRASERHALIAYIAAIKRAAKDYGSIAAATDVIIPAWRAYNVPRPPDFKWKNPATWLDGDCWKDKPAAASTPNEMRGMSL